MPKRIPSYLSSCRRLVLPGQAPVSRLRGAPCQCVQQEPSVDRRSMLLGSLALPAALTAAVRPQQLWTTAVASSSDRQLPKGMRPACRVPKPVLFDRAAHDSIVCVHRL